MKKIIGAIAIGMLVGPSMAGLPAAGAVVEGRVGTAGFTGSSTFDFGVAECVAGPRQTFDASIGSKKDADLHIEGCVDLTNAADIRFTGRFTISWAPRHSITGTAVSVPTTTPPGPCASGIPVALAMELVPVRANGKPRPPVELEGTWCSPATPGVPAPIDGTLTGVLPPLLH